MNRETKRLFGAIRDRHARELGIDTQRRRITTAQNRPGDYVTGAILRQPITWGDRIDLEVRS